MATPDDERLSELEARFEVLPLPDIASSEELARRERVRFAETFGMGVPTFRTSVMLRFYGTGVPGHDLRTSTAGGVITHFADAVRAAGAKFGDATPESLDLFLSPGVGEGSAVLELYGAPRPSASVPTLGGEILDTPVDAALAELFAVLNDVEARAAAPVAAADDVGVQGTLGRHLFALSDDLIRGDVDLDIGWQRPRGVVNRTSLTRARARLLRDLLDRERREVVHRVGRGELTYVSTEGRIGLRLFGQRRTLPLSAEGFGVDELRALWAREVEAIWTETTVSHPQRDTSSISNVLDSIRLAPPHGEQPALLSE